MFVDPWGLCESGGAQGVVSWGSYVGGQSSAVRSSYEATIRGLDASDSYAREMVKLLARQNTPQPMHALIEMQRPSLGPRVGSSGHANISNARWNTAGRVVGRAGNGLVVVSAVMAVGSVATAPQGDKLQTVAEVSGATIVGAGGGIGGAAIGAAVGSVGGPVGALIGSIVGGLGGGIGGGFLGAEAGGRAYLLNTPVEGRF
jgi:hypothetical protein